MTIKTLSIETEENNTTYPTFAPYQFLRNAEGDYLTMRLLYPYASELHSKIAHNAAECLEKIMKAFLLIRGKKTIKEVEKFSHGLENIRLECLKLDKFFGDKDLKDFCENYSGNKKGNEVLRYGYNENTKGYGINIDSIIQLTDKFFIGTFLRIEDSNFHVYNSSIASLLYPTNFQISFLERFSSKAISDMKLLITNKNLYLDSFIEVIKKFSIQLDKTQ